MTPIQNPPPPPPAKNKPQQAYPANTKIANVNQPEDNKPRSKNSRAKKIFLIITLAILALATAAGAFFLLQERQDIRESAAPSDLPSCSGYTTTRCYGECEGCKEYEVCEISGGGYCRNRLVNENSPRCGANCGEQDDDDDKKINPCDDGEGGCCNPNNPYESGCGCRDWEECAVDNGACSSGKSCRVKECLGGGSPCSENWQCCSGYCVNGSCQEDGDSKTYNSCSDYGYQNDPTCTADPNCTSPGQDGFCCLNNNNIPVCCYRNGECYEGQQGRCEDRGSGKIWLAGGLKVEVYKMTGTNVSCPYSTSNRTTIFSGTTQEGGQEFSLGSSECGQIEAIGYCGSCKPGCTTTPTEKPTTIPTETPTSIPYSCECSSVKLYNSSWEQIQPSEVTAGQTIYVAVTGNNSYPNYQFDKGRVRVNKTTWSESDITTEAVPGKQDEFYITYLVPVEGGKVKIEAEVHLNATIADPDDDSWWR